MVKMGCLAGRIHWGEDRTPDTRCLRK